MAIGSTYTTLKSAVAGWLDRADLTARIPEFIELAEADLRRNLRKRHVRAALTLDSAAVTLPTECAELTSVRFNTDTRKYPLYMTTVANLATLRRSGSGIPNFGAVIDGVLLLDITPDTDYEAEITYHEELVSLSESNESNATLTDSPDLYLFATMKEAELYLEHDERNPVWAQKYQKALADENNARERAELGSAPAVMRLPVVFG